MWVSELPGLLCSLPLLGRFCHEHLVELNVARSLAPIEGPKASDGLVTGRGKAQSRAALFN